MLIKILVCTLSPEGINGFKPNLHSYIFWRCKNPYEILVILTPFFKVTVGRRMLKKYPVYTLSPEWMDLTTPAEINHLDMEKYWSDIGDLNLIFKVTGGKKKC